MNQHDPRDYSSLGSPPPRWQVNLAFGLLIGCMVLAAGVLAANASPRHHHHLPPAAGFAQGLGEGLAHVLGIGPRPRAWCGWQMRQWVNGDPGPSFNLARNWAHWGRPASGPAPGVIGVMPHHVFKVVQVLGRGSVLAISGNDSHAVRVRPRSTAGVIAWRMQ